MELARWMILTNDLRKPRITFSTKGGKCALQTQPLLFFRDDKISCVEDEDMEALTVRQSIVGGDNLVDTYLQFNRYLFITTAVS